MLRVLALAAIAFANSWPGADDGASLRDDLSPIYDISPLASR